MSILEHIKADKNLTLLNQTSLAREYFWSSIVGRKDFDDIQIKISNVICEKCNKIISERENCSCIKENVVLSAGRGRKKCKNCPTFSGPRTIICGGCGYNFKTGIIESNFKKKETVVKLSKNKKKKKTTSVHPSIVNDANILINNDKISENILLFKNHTNLSEDQKSAIDSYCIWRDEFLKLNIPLSNGIAHIIYYDMLNKDSIKHFHVEDLEQEGFIGLIKAFTHYDRNRTYDKNGETKNILFSTYATDWIRKSIIDAILNKDKNIFVPVYIINYYKKFTKFYNEYIEQNGNEPSVEEIMTTLKVREKTALGLLILKDIRQKKLISVEETTEKYKNDMGEDTKIGKNDIDLINKLSYEEEYHFDYRQYLNQIDFTKEQYRDLFLDHYGLNEERLEYSIEMLKEKYGVTPQTINNVIKNTLSQFKELLDDEN